ncbi:dihydrouridine synthase, DuS [Psychromonas sp. CNPT3]|uniref:tRNA-dihydrouridine synthase n=1 Tax=Psychromonas sp. CNPT3 TaxID=314282 RepID=UPI00006E85A5|nr:tRNA-dihydrouridine synthase [Psychromonas sp. CNPT3]AGH81405.1 dihydrouridine synthase, DuS [Psychromonas sp. CNPT3]
MKITLAPMEGVMDHHMRALLTSLGGIDLCVTEFIRVISLTLPAKVYRRVSPELFNQSKTPSGTPVRIQLLGQDPQCLANNARKALLVGSDGIDLNFGCPAKAVNKSKGGAILLKSPETLYKIVKEVRASMHTCETLSVKIRLGYADKSLAIENAQAICEAGANELAVHARTKEEGYAPPAHWHWIAKIRESIDIPVTANGDIFSAEDAKRCHEISGCHSLMIGRGALATPNLAQVIKGIEEPYSWPQILTLMSQYLIVQTHGDKEKYLPSRIKQWLTFMRLQQPQALIFLQAVRKIKSTQEMIHAIEYARKRA